MRKFVIAFVASTLLAACGSETSGEFTGEDGEQGEYTIDADSGDANLTITTDEGTTTMQSGENVAVDLPDGFSLYPGVKVVHNTTVNQGETFGTMVIFETEDSSADLAKFYRKQAVDAGLEIEFEMTTGENQMLGGTDKKGRTFTLNVTDETDMRTAQLLVGFDPSIAE